MNRTYYRREVSTGEVVEKTRVFRDYAHFFHILNLWDKSPMWDYAALPFDEDRRNDSEEIDTYQGGSRESDVPPAPTAEPYAPKVGTLQEATDYCATQRIRLRETGWREDLGCNGGAVWSPPWARRIMSLPLRHAWAVQKQLDAVVGATIPLDEDVPPAPTAEPYAAGEFIRLDEDEAALVVEAINYVRGHVPPGKYSLGWAEAADRLWARLRDEIAPTPEPDAPTVPTDADSRRWARGNITCHDRMTIDDNAEVRRANDSDKAAWVQAWVRVRDQS